LTNLTWHQCFKILIRKSFTKGNVTRAGLLCLETESENLIRERKGEREKGRKRETKKRKRERQSNWPSSESPDSEMH